MKTASPEPTAAATGQECPRCAHPLRPDWSFCPTCSLPARPGAEVLSSQIQVLRTTAEENPLAAGGTSLLARWAVPGTALLLAVTAGVGFLVWSPGGAQILLPDAPPAETTRPVDPRLPSELVRLEWMPVPGGSFKYGPPAEGRTWTEEVYVPSFEIMKFEVTNAQWLEYLFERRAYLEGYKAWRSAVPYYWKWTGETPGYPPGQDRLPVRGISFDQAADFCDWLDASGRAPGARLPREEEWEKATRGTEGLEYPWGPSFLREMKVSGQSVPVDVAVVQAENPAPSTAENSTDISPFGVYHMGGNVAEWTDLWGGPGTDPGPRERYRIIRGASFQDRREEGAIYARTWYDEGQMEKGVSHPRVGFRAARTIRAAAKTPAKGGGR